MKRAGLLSIFLGVFLISFVRAYSGDFSLSEFLNSIDPSTMTLGAIFIIIFALVNFALSRALFRNPETKAIGGIVSLAVSVLVVYWLNKSDFSYENFFEGIGISGEIFYTLVPIILLVGIIFIIWRFKKESLLILGILFIGGSFLVYEKTLLIIIGVLLIIVRVVIPRGTWEMRRNTPRRRP